MKKRRSEPLRRAAFRRRTYRAPDLADGKRPGLLARTIIVTVLSALATACGGGSGSVDSANTGPNQSPVANSDSRSIPIPVAVRVDPLANDTDPNGDALFITTVTQPAAGTVEINGNALVYTPGPDFLQSDQFTYTISDERGGTATGQVMVELVRQPGNAAPLARSDQVTVGIGETSNIAVLANDFDPDGDPIAIESVEQPANGSVTIDDNGTPADPLDDRLVYVPAGGFAGPDSIVYRISDGVANAIAVVNVVVGGMPGEQISGTVTKGPATGALVRLHAADADGNVSGPALASAVTDASGYWSTALPNGMGPLIATVAGGHYLDEVLVTANDLNAAVVELAYPGSLASALPAGENFLAITPYSHAVLLRARWLAGAAGFESALASERAVVASALGFDPLSTAPGNPLVGQSGADSSSAYAMALGGLSNSMRTLSSATGVAVPVSGLLRAIAEDLTDCVLNGGSIAGPVNVEFADITIALPDAADLNADILRFRNNNYANFTGTPVVSIDASECQLAALPPPEFTALPGALTVDAETAAGTSATLPQLTAFLAFAQASDAAGNTIAVASNAPAMFALGTTPVVFTAVDGAGNSVSETVDLTVADLSPPVIASPPPVNAPQTGPLTGVALVAPAATDNVSAPADVTISNDAPLAFLPGTTTVTWTARDEAGLTTTALQAVSIVTAGGPSLVASLPDASGSQGTLFEVDTSGAFSTGPHTYSVLGLPPGSGLVIDPATGVIAGTPTNADALASPMLLSVTASNALGLVSAPLNLMIANVNDAPLATGAPAPVAANQGDTFEINLGDYFSDPDLDALVFSATGLPPGLTIAPDGRVTGTFGQPDVTASPFSAVLRASDGLLDTTLTLPVTVANVNDAPVILSPPANRSLTEDTFTSFDVATSFSDPDGDMLTFSFTGLPASMSGSPTGTISGTPVNDDVFGSPFGISVTAGDADGATVTASFLLTIQNVNDVPQLLAPIGDQSAVQDLPFSLDTSTRFADADGDVLTFSASGLPTSLGIDGDGVISGTATAADAAGGPYSITVTATDGSGASAADAFTLTIVDNNTPPQIDAIGDPAPVSEDSAPFDIAFAVSDAESAATSLSVTVTSSNPVLLPPASLTLAGTGGARTLTVSPAADRNGSSSVTVRVSDGTASSETTFAVTVNPVNDAPLFSVSGNILENEDFAGVRSLTVTPAPVPGDEAAESVTYSLSPASVGFADVGIDPGSGTVTVTARADTYGAQTFTITADDGQALNNLATGSFTVTVLAVNDAPVITAQSGPLGTTEETAIVLGLGALSVTDPDNSYPADFTLSVQAGANFTMTGTTVTPDANFVGTLNVPVKVNDGADDSAPFMLSIDVANINDAPVITAQSGLLSTPEETGLAIGLTDLSVSDPDNSYPADFTLSVQPGAGYTVSGQTVTPDTDFVGILGIPVTVNDGSSDSSPFLVAVDVTAVNDVPVITAQSGPLATAEETGVTLSLSDLIVADPDNSYPADFVLTVQAGPDYSVSGTTVTPSTDFVGTLNVPVTVSDGTDTSAPFLVDIEVTSVNDAPVITAQAGTQSTPEETGIGLALTDLVVSDPDNAFPTDFSLAVQAGANYSVAGNVVTPGSNFVGALNVPVTVNDGTDDSAPFVVVVDVTAVNDVPVIMGQAGSLSTPEETDLVLTLADLTVSDPDNVFPADFTLAVQAGPDYTVTGTTVTPDTDYVGTLSVPVTVNDGTADSAVFVVNIDVLAVNDVPIITSQTAPLSTPEESSIMLTLADLVVTDPDNGYPADFTLAVQAGANYTVAGTTVTPGTDFVGTLGVTATVNDGTDDSAPFVVAVDVTAVNDVPVIIGQAGSLSTPEETDLVLTLADLTVSDPDNAFPADFTLAVQAGANYTVAGTTVTPDTDFVGTLNVPVTVNDGTDDSAPFVVAVDVTAVNDVPVITAQSGPLSTPEETDLVLSLADLVVTDPDNGYPAEFTLAVQAGANYTVAGATVTPDTDYVGTLSVPVTVNDGTDDSSPFLISIDVTAVNDVPAITAQSAPLSTPEETDFVLSLADLVVTDPDNSYPADFTLAVQAGANYTVAGTTVTPDTDFVGTLGVTATVNDGNADSAAFVISIDVTNINDAPVITGQAGSLSTPEETDLVLTLTDLTVSDPDNAFPADFTLAVQAGPNYTVTGTTVTPDTDYVGTLSVPVTVNDGTDDSTVFVVNIDVLAVNDVPIITSQTAPLSTPEESSIMLTLADLVVTDPDNGYPADFTLAVQAGANYTVAGTTVTPGTDFVGTLGVTATVNDGTDDSAPFVVAVDVTAVNDVPVITAQSGPLSTPEETDLALTLADLTVTDPDNSYPADFTLAVQAGANYSVAGTIVTPDTDFVGTLNVPVTVNDGTDDSAPFVVAVDVTAVNDVPAITAQSAPLSTPEETDLVLTLTDLTVSDPDNAFPADFTLTVQAGANYVVAGTTITPATDFIGTLNVPVTVNDGTDDSNPFLISIDVTAVNDVPAITAQSAPLSTPEETDLVLSLADLIVTDPDNSYPADFTLAVQAGVNYTFIGTTVTPDNDFSGTLSVSVIVNDGIDNSDPFLVSIEVTNINDAPIITAQSGPLSTPEETDLALTLADLTVTDPDNSYPADFTLAVQAGANYSVAGTTITPDIDFVGTLNVPVTVNDGTDDSAPFVVAVDVTAVNDVPVITGQAGSLSTPEETDLVLTLADLTVSDPDNAFPADFSLAVQAGANYSVAGTTVTPDTDFVGTLNVPVTVNDGTDDSAPFVVAVDVTAVNDVPVITGQAGSLSTPEETDLVVTLANLIVTDPDNSYPADFSLVVRAGANYGVSGSTISPDPEFNGTLAIPVAVDDGSDTSDDFILTVTVEAVNDQPSIAAQQRLVGLQDATFSILPSHLEVVDPDDSYPLGFTISAQPGANYTASGADITPDAGFTGTLNVPVTVTDPSGEPNATSAPFVLTLDIAAGLADLSLTLRVDKTRPAIAEQITLSVTIRNDGPDTATGVSATSVIFAGYKYISDDSGGTLSGAVWDAGTLLPGQEKTLNVILEIENAGPYVLAAEILTSDQIDPDSIPGNFIAGEDDIDAVETPPPGVPQDEDGDGLRDALELLLGTDQKKEDTDGDWVSDLVEYLAGDDPLTPSAGTRIVHADASVATAGTGDDWDTAYATLAAALLDPRVAIGGSLNQPVYVRIADSAMPTAGTDWMLQLEGACDHMVFIGSQDRGQKEDTLPLLTDAGEPTTVLHASGGAHVVIDGCENVWMHGLELTGGDRGASDGGALRAQNGTRLGLREVWARGNTAANGGGLLATGAGTELTVLKSIVAGNAAAQSGGGVAVTDAADLQLTDSSVVRNSSVVGGGGAYVNGGTLVTDRAAISDNETDGNGGGLFLHTDAVSGPGSMIEHSVFSNNVALGSGGGIAVGTSGSFVSVFNTLIVGNVATRGAATSFDDNSASLSNVTAVDNRCTLPTAGAAFYVDNASPVITDSVFTRNLDSLMAAGTFEIGAGSVSSSYNLLEQAPVGAADIDITGTGPAFASAYYLGQATSPAVNSGSLTAEVVGLDAYFTDDTGTTPDVGVLDRGFHYLDGYPAGNPDYTEASPLAGDNTNEIVLTMTPATYVDQLVVVRVDADNDPFPIGHRVVATLEDGIIAQLSTPIGLDPLNDGESVLLIDLGGGDYGFYVTGETLGETDMRLYVDGQLLGRKVKIKYQPEP